MVAWRRDQRWRHGKQRERLNLALKPAMTGHSLRSKAADQVDMLVH